MMLDLYESIATKKSQSVGRCKMPRTCARRNLKWRWAMARRRFKRKLVLMPSKANYRIIPPPPLGCSFTGTRQGQWEDLATIKKRATGTPRKCIKRRREGPQILLQFGICFIARLTGNWEI